MKYRYGTWISTIPEITTPGTYTLNSLISPSNNCYKIASPNSSTEFYMVEYRRQEDSIFENSINAIAFGLKDGPEYVVSVDKKEEGPIYAQVSGLGELMVLPNDLSARLKPNFLEEETGDENLDETSVDIGEISIEGTDEIEVEAVE